MAAQELLQLYSQNHWLADGAQTVWNFTFAGGYIRKDFVKAYRADAMGVITEVPVTESMFTGPFQLTVTPAIPNGNRFVIYRDTPKDNPLVDFTDGARVSEVSLDQIARQATHIAAEVMDGSGGFLLDQLGFKNMKQVVYTGSSVLNDADRGRCHYKTDHTAVTVPNTLEPGFLSTIVNDSAQPMTITFDNAVGILQGTTNYAGKSVWTLAPRNTMSMFRAAVDDAGKGRWLISGFMT